MTCPVRTNTGYSEHTIILDLALSLETINAVHVIGLVVTSVNEELTWSQPLVCVQKKSNLRGPRASVNKVAIEKIVVFLGRETIQSE